MSHREIYDSLDDFLSSDELKQYREATKKVAHQGTLQEEEFDLDSINYLEVIKYPISWGVDMLDKEMGGQPTGKYMMLYGGAGSGKTTLTLQIAIANAKLGNKVCYLSFEMPKKDFVIQNMRTRAGLKQSGVGESTLPTPPQQSIMKKFINSIRDIDIKGFKSQPSMKEFKEILNGLIGQDYKQIIIDNLGMIGRQDSKDEMQLYGEISAYVKEYCDRSGISVVMLHHTNKGSESGNGKRGFSAFRGNGKLADDCDYVVQLQREFMESGGTEATIKVEKDRISGKNGYTLPLEFNEGVFFGSVFR